MAFDGGTGFNLGADDFGRDSITFTSDRIELFENTSFLDLDLGTAFRGSAPFDLGFAFAATSAASTEKNRKVSTGLTDLVDIGQQLAVTNDPDTRASLINQARAMEQAVFGEYVVIDAYAVDGTAANVLASLEALGLINGASYANVVSGLLPLKAIPDLAAIEDLRSVSETHVLTNVGSVTTQQDPALRADEARSQFSVDGSGVSIGVLSNSFDVLNQYADDIASGDLPAGITVLQDFAEDPTSSSVDEGRAMLQLIHDIAPGADLLFATAFGGIAAFANNIIALADAGADIIVDDVFYFAEPFFQDGVIAQAVDDVVARGVQYFSSAGNSGTDSYESFFRDSGRSEATTFSGTAHDFDPGAGVDTRQLLRLEDGESLQISFQYDEPFAQNGGSGPTSDYDITLFVAGTNTIVAESTLDNPLQGVPLEIFDFTNETGTAQNYEIVITRFSGSQNRLLKYIEFAGQADFLEFFTNSPTVVGHANAEGAIAVGASAFFNTPEFGLNPPALNSFSSVGGVPVLFTDNGIRLSTPDDRGGPLFAAADGGNTTFFGSDINFDSDSFPNFFGTSASAPAAAAVAALLRDAVPAATNAQIEQALIDTAIDIPPTGNDLASGAGFIQADAAIQALITATGGGGGNGGPTPGPDDLSGTPGDDVIDALAGDDTVNAGGGSRHHHGIRRQ